MNPWNSFLQTVFQFVKSLFNGVTKRMHRNAAFLMMGATLIAVIPFTAVDFRGGGRNAIVAFAETQGNSEEDGLEETEDTALPETDGNVLEDETTADEISSTGTEAETARNVETGMIRTELEETVGAEAHAASEEAAAAEEPALTAFTGYSDSDYNVLLRIVQAEAGNCDVEGRVMVANVILNRVGDDSFPNTITNVVYQKHQFSPVANGSIKRCRVTAETVEAVERALAGEDLTGGALYFMNRRASSKKNISLFDRHLELLFKHGSHEFFR